MLDETGLYCQTVDTPLEAGVKLMPDEGQELEDPSKYRRLVGKLIYLTITRPNISFAVSLVSQYAKSHDSTHDFSVQDTLVFKEKLREGTTV